MKPYFKIGQCILPFQWELNNSMKQIVNLLSLHKHKLAVVYHCHTVLDEIIIAKFSIALETCSW